MRYAIFLRGVNVGRITITSVDLRKALEPLPVAGVKTLLASGNVVCSSPVTAAELKSQAEESLRESFGYEAWVVVLDVDTVERIVAECPFPADDPDTHTYVTLFSDPEILDRMVQCARSAGEPLKPLGTVAAAWRAPKGGTLRSPLNAFTNKADFKRATTTRNLRTVHKVLAALRA